MRPSPGSAVGSRYGGPEGLRARSAADTERAAGQRGGDSDRLPGEKQTASGELKGGGRPADLSGLVQMKNRHDLGRTGQKDGRLNNLF